jgi:hypothetical protein
MASNRGGHVAQADRFRCSCIRYTRILDRYHAMMAANRIVRLLHVRAARIAHAYKRSSVQPALPIVRHPSAGARHRLTRRMREWMG